MFDFCGYDAFFAGEALFWAQGRDFFFGFCAVEKSSGVPWRPFLPRLKLGGEVWREFASDISIEGFGFCRVLFCSVYVYPVL